MRNHEGDIYDPFVGSGTSIIAAERQNRTCYAMEIDPAYVAAAMLVDNQCLVAQLPPLIPRKRLRPTTRGRTHARLSRTLTRAVEPWRAARRIRSSRPVSPTPGRPQRPARRTPRRRQSRHSSGEGQLSGHYHLCTHLAPEI